MEQIIAAAQLTTAKTDKSVQMQREAEVKVAQHAGKWNAYVGVMYRKVLESEKVGTKSKMEAVDRRVVRVRSKVD